MFLLRTNVNRISLIGIFFFKEILDSKSISGRLEAFLLVSLLVTESTTQTIALLNYLICACQPKQVQVLT